MNARERALRDPAQYRRSFALSMAGPPCVVCCMPNVRCAAATHPGHMARVRQYLNQQKAT